MITVTGHFTGSVRVIETDGWMHAWFREEDLFGTTIDELTVTVVRVVVVVEVDVRVKMNEFLESTWLVVVGFV